MAESTLQAASGAVPARAQSAPPTPGRVPLLARRYTIELRQQMQGRWQALILAAAVFVGMAISALILIAAGVPADELLNEFVLQTLMDRQSLMAVLAQAAPMILVGVGAAIAFRARFWNLGLEGQMIFGAIGATAVSLFELGPPVLRLPLMALAALLMGLLWALAPALLKLKLQVNEIIASLMLNYLAANFLLHLVYGAWKDPKDAFPYSPQFRAFERLPEWFGNAGYAAIALALAATLAAAWFVGASRASLYLRFVDANPRAARALGVPVSRLVLAAVLLSGALSGLAGFAVVTGQEGRLTQAFYVGYGFSGILIAFLARNNPLAASGVALLVAALFVAGRNLQVFYQIPFSMVQLIQAILVICVAASDFFIRHRLRAVARGAD
ncbi:MAG: ABC transporter permease [Comamonadaceae bacterium]|nr:MAG: ABC transporter permease [Comamonadaceae bacterium]